MALPDVPRPEALAAYQKPLDAVGLHASTLQAALDAEPLVILYFLRHLNCLHCRHLVSQLRQMRDRLPRFPKIIFVHQENLALGKALLAEMYPGAAHIADPNRELYALFGVKRLGPLEQLLPKQLFKNVQRSARAKPGFKGFIRNFRTTADPRQLSGMFLFKDGQLRWAHTADSVGDTQPALGMLSLLGKGRDAPAENPNT